LGIVIGELVFMVTVTKSVQPLKAASPIDVTELRSIDFRLVQSRNATPPIVTAEVAFMVTVVRSVQPSNATLPIDVTELRSIELRLVHDMNA
jgi:hypothetical protein